ncbi:MAG: hypothetical protein ACRCYJ_18365, partial [Plesiomonas shigelloides]
MKRSQYIALLIIALSSTTAIGKETLVINRAITEPEVLAAQKAWCAALVDISSTYQKEGLAAAKALAGKVIDSAYGYQMGG